MAVENVNDKLNPKLWKKEELKPEVKEKLFAIAENFISNIKEDEIDLKMKDLIIVGSNANFNYNETSDIDLHIIADMSKIEDDEEKRLLCILYNAYKALFNNKYDIVVKGHEVEIYVEPDETAVQSGGIYSLLNGWIKKPGREVFVASDEETEEFEKQFKEWENRYKEIIEGEEISNSEIEESIDSTIETKILEIDEFFKDLYELRKSALKSDGENSIGNKIFKQFRKLGYLKTLKDLKTSFEEKEMSLEKLETSDSLTEAKADEQRLIDFAGESLAKRFLSIKNRLKSPENDIYYWLKKTPVELEDRVNEIENTISKTKHKKIEKTKGAELVTEENGWKVYRIDTYEASCLYGKGTKWCTASTETSKYFNDYKDKGIVLYYFIRNNEKYALALYSKIVDGLERMGIRANYELYDEKDELITDTQKIKQLNLPKIPGVDLILEVLPTEIEGDVLVKVYPYNKGEFVIPDGIKTIGDSAFLFCTSLESITIPSSVTSIGDSAFAHCDSLTSITIPDSVTEIGKGTFSSCSSLTFITISNSMTKIGSHAFYNCKSLKSINIPNSVTSIGKRAFSGCKSLTSIIIPDSVTSIGDSAFLGCKSLTSITIPDSVTSIDEWAFYSCSSLTSISIPSSVTSIGNDTFAYCSSLTSITIPSSVTEIGNYAFGSCRSLTSITIPSSVTSIGEWAFAHCFSLTIYAEASSKPTGWDAEWNPHNSPVIWNYKNSTNEELKGDIKMITDEELFWHLRDGLVNKKGDYINKTKYSERAKEVLDIFEGNIYVNSSGELDLYPNPDNMFAVSPEQYPKHLLNRDSLLKFKDVVEGEIVMFYNSTDEYGSEYSVLTSHEDLAIKACKGELGKEFAKQRAYAKYVDGEYQEVEINKNMLVSESTNKLYNKNKGEYKNMTKRELIKFLKTATKFLMENQDYVGSYQLLDSVYAVVVRWSPGWGKELRDDAIQASDNPDYALEATIAIYNPSDTPDAWDMPYDKKTGDIIGAGGVGISPNENYKELAEFLLKEYNAILKHDAQSEESLEEGGKGSGNFKTGAQRYNDKKDSGKYYMYNDRTDYTLNTKRLNEEVESVEIFDILGIEEENRESSKHLISQYKELQNKFPQASIWLNGDVDVYVKGKVLGKTADLSAVEERAVEEGEHKKDKIFSRYDAEQERFAKFLLDHDVPAKEVEKLKQDSGLNGNPLAQKYFELKKSLKEEIVEPELPTEVTIDGELLVDDIDDIGEAYLDEVISDWLSDNYGFVHLGFDYDIVGTDVYVFNILWDTSDEYSLEESIKLNEATANFGTNDIINLCSPYVDPDGYRDYIDELREEEPDITEKEIEQRISEVIDNDYTYMYNEVKSYLKEVDDYVIVEPGYYEGFYIKFKFNDGLELAENWFYYDKEYALQEFKNTVEKIKQGLKKSVEQDQLVEYSVAYRASNGETGYNFNKEKEQSLKKIEEAMNKILKEGLEAIEEEFIDEI